MTASETLSVATGRRAGGSLADTVLELLDAGPELVWCEPRPARQPRPGFVGLWAGADGSLEGLLRAGAVLVLEEARLFWPTAALHLLAAGDSVRWAALWEGSDRPGWLDNVPSDGPPSVQTVADLDRLPPEQLLTQRDFNRYGLEKSPAFPERLFVTQYLRRGKLALWRCSLKENA